MQREHLGWKRISSLTPHLYGNNVHKYILASKTFHLYNITSNLKSSHKLKLVFSADDLHLLVCLQSKQIVRSDLREQVNLPHIDEILSQSNSIRVSCDGDGTICCSSFSLFTVTDTDHCSTYLSVNYNQQQDYLLRPNTY